MVLDNAELASLQRRSVQEQPEDVWGNYFLISISGIADTIEPWGGSVAVRDRELRKFWPSEPWLASTVSAMAARNGALSWTLEGPKRTCNALQDTLHSSNFGRGWVNLIEQLSTDLYSTDNGAFCEIIRDGEGPAAPFLGLAHLDSNRVVRTGNLEFPYLYTDLRGGIHKLAWYQAFDLVDMPSPIESMFGVGFCAVSRLLLESQTSRDTLTYQHEKVAGRDPAALHVVSGVASQALTDALKQAQENASNRGRSRYMLPTVLGTLDPTANVSLITIPLKAMPDGWNKDVDAKWYVAIMALAFGVEYQDLAPLPGGNLGTSQQSKTLHLKAKGKGAALFQKLITHRLNFFVLPQNVTFKFDEKDYESEEIEGTVKKLRAETRQIRITSGEISAAVARQIAEDEGDLKDEYLEMLTQEDVTNDQLTPDDSIVQDPATVPDGMVEDQQAVAPPTGAPTFPPTGTAQPPAQPGKPVATAKPKPVPPAAAKEAVDWEARRVELEARAEEEYAAVLGRVRARVIKRIREEAEASE